MIIVLLIAMLPGLALAAPALAQSPNAETAIPYANFQAKIDGELSEWRTPVLSAVIEETTAPQANRNRLRVQLAWTADALLIAGEMLDSDVIVAPSEISVEQYCQFDALQLYIDPQFDSQTRMNGDDIDLIMLPDGRSGVLRGDDLIATLMDARVPQRQSVPLARQYATRRQADGWTFELSIPLAALGKTFTGKMPEVMRVLKLDLAMHDVIMKHPPRDEVSFSAAEIAARGQPKSPDADAAIETVPPTPRESQKLWSLSWNGVRDLGYPSNWRSVKLQGNAPLAERLLRDLGASTIALTGLGFLILTTFSAMLLTEWHARRRLRRLLQQLALPRVQAEDVKTALSVVANSAQEPEKPGSAEPQAQSLAVLSMAPETLVTELDPRNRAFAERTLSHVRANLHADLSPEALAAAMHTSLRSLQRRLRSGMNTTPQDLVLAARLEAAHGLLSNGVLRVSEVAFQVGFDDLSHFSRRFRSAYGVAPSQLSSQLSAGAQ